MWSSTFSSGFNPFTKCLFLCCTPIEAIKSHPTALRATNGAAFGRRNVRSSCQRFRKRRGSSLSQGSFFITRNLNLHPRLRPFFCSRVLEILNRVPVSSMYRRTFVVDNMTPDYKSRYTSCVLPLEYFSHRSCQNDFLIKQYPFRTTGDQSGTYYAWYHYA